MSLFITTLFSLTGRHVPDYIFRSWIFWLLMIVMIIGILLYHNLVTLKRRGRGTGLQSNTHVLKCGSGATTRISYTSEGRSGYVHYRSATSTFSLYYEFGGGNCIAWIDVPRPDRWEEVTGIPLARRDEVLHEIGTRVVNDQVSSGKGYYRIEGDVINIYASH